MDGPEAQRFHAVWSAERQNIQARQDAELARLDRRMEMDRDDAKAAYDTHHKLIEDLAPRIYGPILICLRENLQFKLDKANAEHSVRLDKTTMAHKREMEDHFDKFHRAIKRNPSPASTPAGIPSPVSAVHTDASRASSVLNGIEALPSDPSVPDATSSTRQNHAPVSGPECYIETQSQIVSGAYKALSTATTGSNRSAETTNRATHVETEDRSIGTVSSSKRAADANHDQAPPAKRPCQDDASQAQTNVDVADQNEDSKAKKKKKNRSTLVHKPLTERSTTFDVVSTNQVHYDAIVEYPTDSGLFYTLACEEHGVHFKHRKPIRAAAKHIRSNLHGLPETYELAVQTLGTLVTDCTKEKQLDHNRNVEARVAAGHVPQNHATKFTKATERKAETSVKPNNIEGLHHCTPDPPVPVSSDASGTPKTPSTTTSPARTRGISNPKTFHIYMGKWTTGKRPTGKPNNCYYPVMILGWDSQSTSGLPDTLNDTGLLDEEGEPPGCYAYDQAYEKIISWAPGYEDNGPKVSTRKFPVLFFDQKRTAGWLPASSLAKYPLYENMPDSNKFKKQQEVREWIAEREGFSSWEERQTIQPGAKHGQGKHALVLPNNSAVAGTTSETASSTRNLNSENLADSTSLSKDKNDSNDDESVDVVGINDMDLDDSDSSLDCEASFDSEFKKLLETAGEIPGDMDYTGSQETENGDVGMDDATSPDIVYRKSFISTRSTDTKTVPVSRQQHDDAQKVAKSSGTDPRTKSKTKSTAHDCREGIHAAQALSRNAMDKTPGKTTTPGSKHMPAKDKCTDDQVGDRKSKCSDSRPQTVMTARNDLVRPQTSKQPSSDPVPTSKVASLRETAVLNSGSQHPASSGTPKAAASQTTAKQPTKSSEGDKPSPMQRPSAHNNKASTSSQLSSTVSISLPGGQAPATMAKARSTEDRCQTIEHNKARRTTIQGDFLKKNGYSKTEPAGSAKCVSPSKPRQEPAKSRQSKSPPEPRTQSASSTMATKQGFTPGKVTRDAASKSASRNVAETSGRENETTGASSGNAAGKDRDSTEVVQVPVADLKTSAPIRTSGVTGPESVPAPPIENPVTSLSGRCMTPQRSDNQRPHENYMKQKPAALPTTSQAKSGERSSNSMPSASPQIPRSDSCETSANPIPAALPKKAEPTTVAASPRPVKCDNDDASKSTAIGRGLFVSKIQTSVPAEHTPCISATPIADRLPSATPSFISTASPGTPVSSLFPAEFTAQLYAHGTEHWERPTLKDSCIRLSVEGNVLTSEENSPVQIIIDPSAMRTFTRRSFGVDNYRMVLNATKSDEHPVHIVFGQAPGLRGESGKKQSRRFVRWMQSVNPSIMASDD